MGLMDWMGRGKKKDLTLEEVRREEIRLGIHEQQTLSKLEKIERERDDIFQRGAKIKSPLKRRQLARDYELKSRNVGLMERELAMLSKELTTISAIRLTLERRQMSRDGVSQILQRMSETQLRTMLEDDKISSELYLERLGEVLSTVTEGSDEIVHEIGKEGGEVLDVWQQMDEGEIENAEEGLRKARDAMKAKEKAGRPELEAEGG